MRVYGSVGHGNVAKAGAGVATAAGAGHGTVAKARAGNKGWCMPLSGHSGAGPGRAAGRAAGVVLAFLMATAAREARGPAEIVFTRMPYLRPASHASTCGCTFVWVWVSLCGPCGSSFFGVVLSA